MTYDQGREMVKHADITQKTGLAIYFADAHRPWQLDSNENTNELLRQYLPKGTDLTDYTQEELDEIVNSLNTRTGKTLHWQTPLEVYAEGVKEIGRKYVYPAIALYFNLRPPSLALTSIFMESLIGFFVIFYPGP